MKKSKKKSEKAVAKTNPATAALVSPTPKSTVIVTRDNLSIEEKETDLNLLKHTTIKKKNYRLKLKCNGETFKICYPYDQKKRRKSAVTYIKSCISNKNTSFKDLCESLWRYFPPILRVAYFTENGQTSLKAQLPPNQEGYPKSFRHYSFKYSNKTEEKEILKLIYSGVPTTEWSASDFITQRHATGYTIVNLKKGINPFKLSYNREFNGEYKKKLITTQHVSHFPSKICAVAVAQIAVEHNIDLIKKRLYISKLLCDQWKDYRAAHPTLIYAISISLFANHTCRNKIDEYRVC